MAETYSHVCVVCDKELKTASNLSKHLRQTHGATFELTTPNRSLICPLCCASFVSKSYIEKHFKIDHGYNLEKEFLEFSKWATFLKWKDEMEKENFVSFNKKCGSKKINGAKMDYFYCYRSGEFKENECRKRRLKTLGSNKINGICPAMIKVIYTDDVIKVTFTKTHIGHDLDVRRLRLTQEEKQSIADRLMQNMSVDSILETVRNGVFDQEGRMGLLNRKDILNIKKEFNIDNKPTLQNSECVSHDNEVYPCSFCDKNFKSKSGLLAHQRTIHSAEYKCIKNSRKLLCILCSDLFTSKKVLEKHFITDHGYNLEKELLQFSNKAEFMTWKNDVEKNNNASFYQKYGPSIKDGLKTQYLYCSGNDKFLEIIGCNERAPEFNNVMCVCPATIKVTYNDDAINVVFTKTHIGHETDGIKLHLVQVEDQSSVNAVDDILMGTLSEDNSNLLSEQQDCVNDVPKITEVLNGTDSSPMVCNEYSDESSVAVIEKSSDYSCTVCEKQFKKSSNLYRHQRIKHGAMYEYFRNRTLMCPLCSSVFVSKNTLENHFTAEHGYAVEKELLEFSNKIEFLEWKDKTEKENNVSFCKKSGSKKVSGVKIDYFYCYRSGEYKDNDCRKRRVKALGSNKINGVCPAMMKVIYSDEIIKVTFTKTHIGHDTDIRRLRLTREERQNIAEQLANDKPVDAILEEVRKSSSEEKGRLSLLSRRDIMNIKKEFNIDKSISSETVSTHVEQETLVYTCVICAKIFKSSSGLARHKKLHCVSDEVSNHNENLCCPWCSVIFTSVDELHSHIETSHGYNLEIESVANHDETGNRIEATSSDENSSISYVSDGNIIHVYVTEMPDEKETASVIYFVPQETVQSSGFTDETEIAVNTLLKSN